MASPVQLTRIWATGPQTPNRDPGAAKWGLGWVSEIPTLQVLNFINNRNDTNQLALAERGAFPWTTGVVYKLGALTWNERNSLIYRAKVASPSLTLAPDLNLNQWETSSIQISRAAYDAAAANWASHIANRSNPHGLTAHQLGSYTTQEIDAKVLVVQNSINAHTSIVAGNPHNTTAADVNAVPVTGGTYTGVVGHRADRTLVGPVADGGALFALTSGIYIGKGASAKVGLNSSSLPVFINAAGVTAPLMTEAAYATQRLVEAPLYAVPLPDLWAPVKNGTKLVTGAGVAVFTGAAGRPYTGKDNIAATSVLNKPMLTPEGERFVARQDKLTMPTTDNIKGFNAWSIYMEYTASTGNQDYFTIPQVTGAGWRLYSQAGGLYLDYYINGVLYTSVIPPNPTPAGSNKLLFSMAGTAISVYLNGVLTTTIAIPVRGRFADGLITLGFGGTAGATMYIREFKTWSIALTAKQASQL